ncbi:MAG: hypothetical protein K0U59_06235, partial [Gammaproteobacteria bacterium]|nr:hypothetical protein [Gammaproteobacteria bacterium]
ATPVFVVRHNALLRQGRERYELLGLKNSFIEDERVNDVSSKTASLDNRVSFGVSHLSVCSHRGMALS